MQQVEPELTRKLCARNDSLTALPARLCTYLLEKLTTGSQSSRDFLLLLCYTSSLKHHFFKKRHVCFREPICVLLFCNLSGPGMVTGSRVPLAKELLEPSGTLNEAGCG